MVQAAILGLQVLLAFITWLKQTQSMDAGRDAEIAKASAAILMKTDAAKAIMQQVTGMTDEQVDAALKGLEP